MEQTPQTAEVQEIQTRQVGLITFGAGLNKDAWIAKAKQDGFIVKEFDDYAELHVEVKIKGK